MLEKPQKNTSYKNEWEAVLLKVWTRDKYRCVLTGESKWSKLERTPHHCFRKSEYFGKDRDEAWNLVTISREAHRKIHFGNTKEETDLGKEYDKRVKLLAMSFYKGKNIKKLEETFRNRHGKL